jgi:hypothetical protein
VAFVPIAVDDYVRRFLRNNPGTDPSELRGRLLATLEAFRQGTCCACGERIWVLGSAEVGLACFTCITGEADPSDDFELEEACLGGGLDE